MKNTQRYSTKGSEEAEYQAGSRARVLKNLLGITSEAEIEQIETLKFVELSKEVILSLPQDKAFSESDIIEMHREWLKEVYSWAEQYRSVNMSKGGFTFAAAHLLLHIWCQS